MKFKGLTEFLYVRCLERKKGSGGYYVELVDGDFNKYRFYSYREFNFKKGQKVIPILELYTYQGRVQFRLLDLEVV